MHYISNYVQRFLLFFGERLALVLLFGILVAFLFLRTPQQVFSKEEAAQFVPQDAQWYKTVSVNPDVPVANNTESHSIILITVTPSPSPTPAPTVSSTDDSVWLRLAECESHQNWSADTGNGYYGGLQFSEGAWNSVGGVGLPSHSSKEEQIIRGKMLQNARGWSPWGGCSKKLGLL